MPSRLPEDLSQVPTEKLVDLIERLQAELCSREGGAAADQVDSLSGREREVLKLLGKGLTSREVAERLGLSSHTIETYREKIKKKLGLKNAAELWHFAVRWTMGNEQSG